LFFMITRGTRVKHLEFLIQAENLLILNFDQTNELFFFMI